MNSFLNLNKDGSEQVKYDFLEFPVYIRSDLLSHYPNYSAESHWHDDIEFLYVLSGELIYSVNGQNILITEGNGIFINCRQLHYGFSPDYSECEFICFLLHPMLLCSSYSVEKIYVLPLLSNCNFPYYLLKTSDKLGLDILSSLKQMYAVRNNSCTELEIQSLFLHIWSTLYKIMPQRSKNVKSDNHQLTELKNMIKYIQCNYKNKITLNEIASAGSVCKSSCCTLFQKYLNKTPIAYLLDFRLRKSIELLTDSHLNISEISYECGFSGASYYSETFKKHFGCTPSEYKKQ